MHILYKAKYILVQRQRGEVTLVSYFLFFTLQQNWRLKERYFSDHISRSCLYLPTYNANAHCDFTKQRCDLDNIRQLLTQMSILDLCCCCCWNLGQLSVSHPCPALVTPHPLMHIHTHTLSIMSEAPATFLKKYLHKWLSELFFSFFMFWSVSKVPGISPHPPPPAPPPSSSCSCPSLSPSPLFALICPQCFALTERVSCKTCQQFRFDIWNQSAHKSYHSVQASITCIATLKARYLDSSFFQNVCFLLFFNTVGKNAQLIYQLAPSGATDLLQWPGSSPDHCQRDGLNGFRPLLMLFSNVLTFPQPPPPLIRSSYNAWK